MISRNTHEISTDLLTDPYLESLSEYQLRTRLKSCLNWVLRAKWDISKAWTQEVSNLLNYWTIQQRWVENEIDRRGIQKRRAM